MVDPHYIYIIDIYIYVCMYIYIFGGRIKLSNNMAYMERLGNTFEEVFDGALFERCFAFDQNPEK